MILPLLRSAFGWLHHSNCGRLLVGALMAAVAGAKRLRDGAFKVCCSSGGNSNVDAIPDKETQAVLEGAPPEAKRPAIRPGSLDGPQFRELSEEVHSSVLFCLYGHEAAKCAALSRLFHGMVEDSAFWQRLILQEMPSAAVGGAASAQVYRELYYKSQCKAVEWRPVACSHRLGGREGSPGVFYCHGYVFVYGGWGPRGPASDLHCGKLEFPLQLREIPVLGRRMQPSYEMAVTLLMEEEEALATELATGSNSEGCDDEKVVRVAVTGGYLYGGYQAPSPIFGIFEISFPSDGSEPSARWVHVAQMVARANHTGTYIPPRIAGEQYPKGQLMLIGGNESGLVSSTVSTLDLDTLTWTDNLNVLGPQPAARNCHSANWVRPYGLGDALLVAGGGNGDETNGSAPRGGRDVMDSFFLSGFGTDSLQWTPVPSAEGVQVGRGHRSLRISGTDTVLTFSGGRPPAMCAAVYREGRMASLTRMLGREGSSVPPPRAFGGGCQLPGGLLLIYGGWHPRGSTYDDVWIARVQGARSELWDSVREPTMHRGRSASDDDDDDDEDEFMFARRQRGILLRRLLELGPGGGNVSLEELARNFRLPNSRPSSQGDEDEDDAELDEEEDEEDDEAEEVGEFEEGEALLEALEPLQPLEAEDDDDDDDDDDAAEHGAGSVESPSSEVEDHMAL